MAGDRTRPAAEAVAIRLRHRGIDGPGSAGGDFYVHCETDGSIRAIIGDVRGKGAPAARKASLLADAFPALAAVAADLDELSCALDRLVSVDAAREADLAAREWFATAILFEIDRSGRRVVLINHGHPAPVLVGPGRVTELAPSRARLPLGLGDLAWTGGSADPAPYDTVELRGDATLILFTDGVTEARDGAGRMFDPIAWLAATPAEDDSAPLLDRLYLEVARHNGGSWHDDLVLVSVRRRTESSGIKLVPIPPQQGAAAQRPAHRDDEDHPPIPAAAAPIQL